MNYLISGTSGFIGSHLTQKIREKGHTVFSIFRDFSVHLDAPAAEDSDLLDSETTPIDVVIHCAASHPSQGCDDNLLLSGNLTFTEQLLDRILKRHPMVVIFLSTISIYGHPRPRPLQVFSPIIHPSVYGRVKKQTEELVQNWGEVNDVVTHCVRLPAVLGKHEHQTFLPKLIGALRTGDSINTHSLKSLFNHIVHVDDACRFLIKLSMENKCSSVTQLASSDPLELEKVVGNICAYFNIKRHHVCPSVLETSYVDISEAKKLGFQTMSTEALLHDRCNANRSSRP